MFTDKLKTLDRKIGPALSRITWNHKGIVDFCRDARKVCSSTQGLKDSFKEYTSSIVRCTREMSNLPLIFMKHKHLYNAEEFENAQRKHRNQTVQVLSHLADDVKGSLKGLFRLFAGDNAESIREWDRYIMGVDKNIEKALSDASKKSLQEMSRVINADNASESQAPLFSVRVTLDTQNRVIYTPSPAELMQLINLCAKELMAMLDVVPRLSGVVEDGTWKRPLRPLRQKPKACMISSSRMHPNRAKRPLQETPSPVWPSSRSALRRIVTLN